MFKREAKEGPVSVYENAAPLDSGGSRSRVEAPRRVSRGLGRRFGTWGHVKRRLRRLEKRSTDGGKRCRCVRRKGPLTAHAQFEAMERRVVYCCILKRRSVRSVNAAPKGGRSVGPDKRTNLHAAAECSETAPFRRIVRGTTRVPWSVDATAEGASRRVSGGAKHPALGVAAG